MRVRRWVWTAVVVLVLLAVFALLDVLPTSPDSYRSDAASTAQEALSAGGTAALVGRASLDGNVFSGYASVALSDARTAASQAVDELLAAQAPAESLPLRDQLQPLLADTAASIAGLQAHLDADDTDRAAAAVDHLTALTNQLSEFIEANK